MELNMRCERRVVTLRGIIWGPAWVALVVPDEPLPALCNFSELVLQCLLVYAMLDQS